MRRRIHNPPPDTAELLANVVNCIVIVEPDELTPPPCPSVKNVGDKREGEERRRRRGIRAMFSENRQSEIFA